MSNLDFDELLDKPCCFWFGLPPCPKCGSNHGDPKCSPREDAEKRAALSGRKLCRCGSYAGPNHQCADGWAPEDNKNY